MYKGDENLLQVLGVMYDAIDDNDCISCDTPSCFHNGLCGSVCRKDKREISWKRKETKDGKKEC